VSDAPIFEAQGITKRFSGIRALDDVSMAVGASETIGLIGPNGAGKTTFFNCVFGIIRPDAGRVLFDGRDITRAPVYKRARLGFGRTFQRMELFGGMTVRDHLLVAERARSRAGSLAKDLIGRGRPTTDETERADAVLELLGLDAMAARPVEALTLGQGRLVELARALMADPKVLFLDEPSSGLDVTETAEVADTLERIQSERTMAVVLVEHDVTIVQRLCHRLYVLDFGTLIASGVTDDVLADDKVRAAYLGVGA
jgi:branched-chain amino acid transport system ATP-binding protein